MAKSIDPNTIIIYGSGDSGSYELRRRFRSAKLKHTFRDIRNTDNAREHLAFLTSQNINTVPALFNTGLEYLGNYDAGIAMLSGVPETAIVAPESA